MLSDLLARHLLGGYGSKSECKAWVEQYRIRVNDGMQCGKGDNTRTLIGRVFIFDVFLAVGAAGIAHATCRASILRPFRLREMSDPVVFPIFSTDL